MEYNGERFLPDQCQGEIFIEHYQRYQFAGLFSSGKMILDAACGEGYGSSLLAANAAKVTGLDIDPSVIRNAREKYGGPNLSFLAGDIGCLPFENACFDMVVSFETIEHVDIPTQEAFLREIRRVLKPRGLLLISTPNKAVYTDRVGGTNHFHIREFYVEEYRGFLRNAFPCVTFFGQSPDLGYFISRETQNESVLRRGKHLEDCRYLLALCSDHTPDSLPDTDSLARFDDSMYYFLNAAVHRLEQDVLATKSEAEGFQAQLEQNITDLKDRMAVLETTVEEHRRYAEHLERDVEGQRDYITRLESDRDSLKEYILRLEENGQKQAEYAARREKDLEEQKLYIAHLEKDLEEQKLYIAHLEKDLREQADYIPHLERDLEEQRQYIRHLEKDIKTQADYLSQLENRETRNV